jgi:hypothetical protein
LLLDEIIYAQNEKEKTKYIEKKEIVINEGEKKGEVWKKWGVPMA